MGKKDTKFIVPKDLEQPTYVNAVRVHCTDHEFLLDFAFIDIAEAADQEPILATVRNRISMPPDTYAKVLGMLQTVKEQHEAKRARAQGKEQG